MSIKKNNYCLGKPIHLERQRDQYLGQSRYLEIHSDEKKYFLNQNQSTRQTIQDNSSEA